MVQGEQEVQAWGLTGMTQTTKCNRESPSGACVHRGAAHTCSLCESAQAILFFGCLFS